MKFFIFLILIIVFYLFSPHAEVHICAFINCGEYNSRYFDALNSAFTGLAFIGLLLTISLQQKEIKDTRKDVDEQNKTLSLQRFESSFFSLLRNHKEFVTTLGKDTKKGEPYFLEFLEDVEKEKSRTQKSLLDSYRDKFSGLNKVNLDGFFSNFDLILKYIRDANIEDKKVYHDMLVVQQKIYILKLMCLEIGRNPEDIILKYFLKCHGGAMRIYEIIKLENGMQHKNEWLEYLKSIDVNIS